MSTIKSLGHILARKMTRDLLLGIPDKTHKPVLTNSQFWKQYSTHQIRLICHHEFLAPLLDLEIGQAAVINFAECGKPTGYQILDPEGKPDGEYRCIG